jgi:hypothetical protein
VGPFFTSHPEGEDVGKKEVFLTKNVKIKNAV